MKTGVLHFKKPGLIALLCLCVAYLMAVYSPEEKPILPVATTHKPAPQFHAVVSENTPPVSPQPIILSLSKNNLPKISQEKEPIWGLKDTGLSQEELSSFFKEGEPTALVIKQNARNDIFLNPNLIGSGNAIGKILHLSNPQAIQEVIHERMKVSDSHLHSPPSPETRLRPEDYEVVSFQPGFTDGHQSRIKVPNNLAHSVAGPDHHFNPIDPNDKSALADLSSRTVSFGHGGEMVLQVKHGGWIFNREGPDFAVFENPIRLGNSGLIYQEFAHVGVAKENIPEKYQWFECKPLTKNIAGCAGVVPTDEGGDQFDLSALGIDKIRFIKIRDTGQNKNLGLSTEGFDLDALYLFHAFAKAEF